MVTTVRREVHEEVGLELEMDMRMVGGWQDAKSRDRTVNNIFCVFVATAKSRNVKVDGVEISEAQWFPIASLPALSDERQVAKNPKKPFGMEWDLGMPGRNIVSRTVVRFLDVFQNGRGLNVQKGNGDISSPLDARDLFS